MHDRRTDRAREAMRLARMAAHAAGHRIIEVPHLLWGMLEEGSGVGCSVLHTMGVEHAWRPDGLEDLARIGEPPAGSLAFGEEAHRALMLALEEAAALGHDYIGTEHLLLGCLAARARVMVDLAQHHGVALAELRDRIVACLGPCAPRPPGDLREAAELSRLLLREIVDLHAAFEKWFRGELTTMERMAAAMHPDLVFVSPAGQRHDRKAVLQLLQAARGARSVRISVRARHVHRCSAHSALATYEEHQVYPTHKTARLATAQFLHAPGAPGGVLWRHVHETWIVPPEAEHVPVL